MGEHLDLKFLKVFSTWLIPWFLCSLLRVPMPGWYPKLPSWRHWELQMLPPLWQHSAAQKFQKQNLRLTYLLRDFISRENCCMFWNSEPEAGKQNPKGWDPQRKHLQIAKLRCCASWTNSCGTVVLREGKGSWGATELQWKGMDSPTSLQGRKKPSLHSCWPGHAH